MAPKSKRVREPIQVYLTPSERGALDALARELGVSRAEVLRRGIEALAGQRARSFFSALDPLIGAFSEPDAPPDLAERHDEYLAEDTESLGASA